MPSSSRPEPPPEAAQLALDEIEEAEAILDQQPPKAEGVRAMDMSSFRLWNMARA